MNQLNRMIQALRLTIEFEKQKDNPNIERIELLEDELKVYLKDIKI